MKIYNTLILFAMFILPDTAYADSLTVDERNHLCKFSSRALGMMSVVCGVDHDHNMASFFNMIIDRCNRSGDGPLIDDLKSAYSNGVREGKSYKGNKLKICYPSKGS